MHIRGYINHKNEWWLNIFRVSYSYPSGVAVGEFNFHPGIVLLQYVYLGALMNNK
jgi:hypothetical protein